MALLAAGSVQEEPVEPQVLGEFGHGGESTSALGEPRSALLSAIPELMAGHGGGERDAVGGDTVLFSLGLGRNTGHIPPNSLGGSGQ